MGETIRRWGRLQGVAYAAIIAAIIVLSALLPRSELFLGMERRIAAMGPWGAPAFTLIYALAVGIYLPALPFTIAAGALFDPVVGSLSAWVGSTAGAGLGFLAIRHLAREAVARKIRRHPKFEAFDEGVARSGWRIVALLRLTPMPFVTMNALAGVSAIRFWPFFLATAFAKLPGTVALVYSIHLGRTSLAAGPIASLRRDPWGAASLALSLLATIAAPIYIARLARRSLADRLEPGEDLGGRSPTIH